MQSVTSNAVYSVLNTLDTWSYNGLYLYKIGRMVFFIFQSSSLSGSNTVVCDVNIIPTRFKPIQSSVKVALIDNTADSSAGQFSIYEELSARAWATSSFTTHVYQTSGAYVTAI